MLRGKLNHDATYWEPSAPTGFGNTGWSGPIHVRVRWQDKQQLVRDKEGREVTSDAVVYLARPINLQGRLQRGVHTGDPGGSAREPKAASSMEMLDGQTVGYKVWL